MEEDQNTNKVEFRVALPRSISVGWTYDDRPRPYLTNDDTDEPMSGAETACLINLLTENQYARNQAWVERGIQLAWQHIVPGEQESAYARGYREGFAAGRKEANESGDDAQYWYVYLIRGLDLCKIGISTKVKRRLNELQSKGGASSLELIATAACRDRSEALTRESALHRDYALNRMHGEWFDLDDHDIKRITKRLADMEAETLFGDESDADTSELDNISELLPQDDDETTNETSAAD